MSIKSKTVTTSYLGVELEGKVQYSPKHLVLTIQSPFKAIALKREIDFFLPKMFTDSYAKQTAETLLKEIFEDCIKIKSKGKEFLDSVSNTLYTIKASDLRRDISKNRQAKDILLKAVEENRLTRAEFQKTYYYVQQHGHELRQKLNELIDTYYKNPLEKLHLHGRNRLNAIRQVLNVDIDYNYQLIQNQEQDSETSLSENASEKKLTIKDELKETTETLNDGRLITDEDIANRGTFAIIPLWHDLPNELGEDFTDKLTNELTAKLFFNGFKIIECKYYLIIADNRLRKDAPEIIERMCKNYFLQPHIYTGLYNTDDWYEKLVKDLPDKNISYCAPFGMSGYMRWAARTNANYYKKLQETDPKQIHTYSPFTLLLLKSCQSTEK